MEEITQELTQEGIVHNIIITDKIINNLLMDDAFILSVQTKFNRISRKSVKKFIKLVLERTPVIYVNDIMDKTKAFCHWESGKVDKDTNSFKSEFILEVKKTIEEYILINNSSFNELLPVDSTKIFAQLTKFTTYTKIRDYIGEMGDTTKFFYDFLAPDLISQAPQNISTLQRSDMQIMGQGVEIDYPLEYVYPCMQCGNTTIKKANETVTTNGKIKCQHLYNYTTPKGETKTKICEQWLKPDEEISRVRAAFFYNVRYENTEGKFCVGQAISFERYDPGYYDVVYFRLNNPKKEKLFKIVAIKNSVEAKTLILPEQTEENYFFTLQRALDRFILEHTGLQIYGLLPIKVALIIQTLAQRLNKELVFNTQLIGDPSTGKSMILKYYGVLLNNSWHLSTNGVSVSVPGMRGTPTTIMLLGKDYKFMSLGHLGTYKSIHIDEAGENKELVTQLKNWLYEANYSYDKAGTLGNTNIRTCHVNLSENLDNKHLGIYRGGIRKAYKDNNIQIGDEPKDEWDESWDLHLPIYKYTNPYLRKAIKDKREEFHRNSMFWIDGHDLALHERFPFYFYLVNEKTNIELEKVASANVLRSPITEVMKLTKILKTDVINDFFNSIIDYKIKVDLLEETRNILNNYGIKYNTRELMRYMEIIRYSCIINNRKEPNKTDYELLKWFLEKTNCKLDITQTNDYIIEGPPDQQKILKEDLLIEEQTKKAEDIFSVPQDFD